MEYTILNVAMEQVIHLFCWGAMLALVVTGTVRLAPDLKCWSAMWKAILLLSLLPLIPWSHLDFKVVQIPMAYEVLPDFPTVWDEVSSASHGAVHNTDVSAKKTALFHLLALTVVSAMFVSVVRVSAFFYQLVQFNRTIAGYPSLRRDSEALAFLSQEQKASLASHNIQIVLSDASTSPFATGLIHRRIVLPGSFFCLSARQQRLLLEHEITHIKRGDLFWLMLSQLIKCMLWFTPLIHLVKPKLDLSIELECDRQVLDTYPGMSKEYGSALINVVRQTQNSVHPQAAFFISQQFSDLKSRISYTQNPMTKHGDHLMNKVTLLVTAAAFSATSWAINTNVPEILTVEEFVVLHKNASRSIDANETMPIPSGQWINPVKTSWVSSTFKAKQKFRSYRPHLGIDLAASLGDSIVAASNGVVIVADDQSLHKNHGNVVIIDHGDQTFSMYSHMGHFDVSKGDVVSAGQLIGKVGVTGKTTGPHLHFEIITASYHIDPASVIEFNYR